VRAPDFGRVALSTCVAAAFLADCGGSQPTIGAPDTMPQSAAMATHVAPAKSWMLPGAYTKAQNAGRAHAAVEFVYVTNLSSNNVSAYAINASTGALTQLTGSPFAAGYQPSGVAIDSSGKFLYVANNGSISGHYSGNVSAYAILVSAVSFLRAIRCPDRRREDRS
jgi:Lactonase, 7-bladed beta-propeller